MNHLKKEQIKTCIVLTIEELQNILKEYFTDVTVQCVMDGLRYASEVDISDYDVCSILSEHFEITVTSLHIDDSEYALVWVCYEEPPLGVVSDPIETKCDYVLSLHNNTPSGVIRDADTILQDYLDNNESEITGLAPEIIKIIKSSTDKSSACRLFECFVDVSFDEYLNECQKNITRAPETDITEPNDSEVE